VTHGQLELDARRTRLLGKLTEALPDFMGDVSAVGEGAYRDGALSTKIKRLMALAIALRAGCTHCILAQTHHALDAGATRDEVLETITVEISMSGTTGVAESLRVVELMEELGDW